MVITETNILHHSEEKKGNLLSRMSTQTTHYLLASQGKCSKWPPLRGIYRSFLVLTTFSIIKSIFFEIDSGIFVAFQGDSIALESYFLICKIIIGQDFLVMFVNIIIEIEAAVLPSPMLLKSA